MKGKTVSKQKKISKKKNFGLKSVKRKKVKPKKEFGGFLLNSKGDKAQKIVLTEEEVTRMKNRSEKYSASISDYFNDTPITQSEWDKFDERKYSWEYLIVVDPKTKEEFKVLATGKEIRKLENKTSKKKKKLPDNQHSLDRFM